MPSPANTSLGSIGLGYIYTDWLSQINYTTPDMGGAKVTVGIFDPLNTLGQTPVNHSTPGFQGKIAYTAGPLYLSASGLYQQQRVLCTDLTAGACAAGSARRAPTCQLRQLGLRSWRQVRHWRFRGDGMVLPRQRGRNDGPVRQLQ